MKKQRLIKMDRKDISLIVVGIFFIVIQTALELMIPGYMSELTTEIQNSESTLNGIIVIGVKMFFCALISFAIAIIVSYIVAKVSAMIGKKARTTIYNKIMSFSMADINHFSIDTLITRLTSDIVNVQTFAITIGQTIIKFPILLVMVLGKILVKRIEWTIATIVAIVLMIAGLMAIYAIIMKKYYELQKKYDDLNQVAREKIEGIKVVRAYNSEEYETKKFKKINNSYTGLGIFVNKVLAMLVPIINIISNCFSVVIYIIGAIIIMNVVGAEKINSFSDMIVFSSYALQLISAFLMLIMSFMQFSEAKVSLFRLNEVLNKEATIKLEEKDKKYQIVSGDIEFKNVGFKYNESAEKVLNNINIKINHGEFVAIVGPTASGKTTLVNLINRIFDVNEGNVYIDDIDVRDYELNILRNNISFVSQTTNLFKGTIKSNICLGKNYMNEYTEQEIMEALRIAQIDDFVLEQDEKLEYEISQNAVNLSGGQKQRLSIARAIIKKQKIFIFDDSFSALDYLTELKLRTELRNKFPDSTFIVVTQRVRSVMDADKIIVLSNGEVAAIGTHKELIENSEIYKKITRSQILEEDMVDA